MQVGGRPDENDDVSGTRRVLHSLQTDYSFRHLDVYE